MRSAPSRSAPPPRFSSGGVAAAAPAMPSDRVPNASPVAAPDAWYASPSFWKSKSGSVKKRKAVSAPWEAKPAPVAAPCCAKGIQPPFSAGAAAAAGGGLAPSLRRPIDPPATRLPKSEDVSLFRSEKRLPVLEAESELAWKAPPVIQSSPVSTPAAVYFAPVRRPIPANCVHEAGPRCSSGGEVTAPPRKPASVVSGSPPDAVGTGAAGPEVMASASIGLGLAGW